MIPGYIPVILKPQDKKIESRMSSSSLDIIVSRCDEMYVSII